LGDRLVFLGDRLGLGLCRLMEGFDLDLELGDRLRIGILAAESVDLLLKGGKLLSLFSNYTVFFFIQSSFSASCRAWRADCIRFS